MIKDIINEHFENLVVELADIPRERIYNYDETNVTDDPGSKTVIVRRGHGHRVERKQDHSKQSTSVMFAGNAVGDYLPPMVVYKAQNLYSSWTEGGPLNAVYDVTKSGWFDSRTFEKWLFELFLFFSPTAYPGVTVLTEDNLGSHFSSVVIEATLANDVKVYCVKQQKNNRKHPGSRRLCLCNQIYLGQVFGFWYFILKVQATIVGNPET